MRCRRVVFGWFRAHRPLQLPDCVYAAAPGRGVSAACLPLVWHGVDGRRCLGKARLPPHRRQPSSPRKSETSIRPRSAPTSRETQAGYEQRRWHLAPASRSSRWTTASLSTLTVEGESTDPTVSIDSQSGSAGVGRRSRRTASESPRMNAASGKASTTAPSFGTRSESPDSPTRRADSLAICPRGTCERCRNGRPLRGRHRQRGVRPQTSHRLRRH